MFAVNSECDRTLIRSFLMPDQVGADILAQQIPGAALHLKSLDAAMSQVKTLLHFVSSDLQTDDWEITKQENYGFHLSAGCSMLAGALDGMIIFEKLSLGESNLGKLSFTQTKFSCEEAAIAQKQVKDLRSPREPVCKSQDLYVDFFSVTNFWKHYMPIPPLPKYFPQDQVFDFQLEFGGIGITVENNLKVRASVTGMATTLRGTGPIMHDLLMPAYDAACTILHILAKEEGVTVSCSKYSI